MGTRCDVRSVESVHTDNPYFRPFRRKNVSASVPHFAAVYWQSRSAVPEYARYARFVRGNTLHGVKANIGLRVPAHQCSEIRNRPNQEVSTHDCPCPTSSHALLRQRLSEQRRAFATLTALDHKRSRYLVDASRTADQAAPTPEHSAHSRFPLEERASILKA